jgi:hypothetical protein
VKLADMTHASYVVIGAWAGNFSEGVSLSILSNEADAHQSGGITSAKTDDDERPLDEYLGGQTGVLLVDEPAPPLPPPPRQEDLPSHMRDYRHGQTGVLLDNESEL